MQNVAQLLLASLVVTVLLPGAAVAQGLPDFDFSTPAGRAGWLPAHDVGALEGTADGMVVPITGGDPYIIGPARDYPADTPLWMYLRLKPEQAGMGQVFYFTGAPTEEHSVRFPAKANAWQEVRLPLPALGPGYHLRIDPPGTGGQAVIAWLRFAPRVMLKEPNWPEPTAEVSKGRYEQVKSGDLTVAQGPGGPGDIRVEVGGQLMAVGYHQPLIGYDTEQAARWLDVRQGLLQASAGPSRTVKAGNGVQTTYSVRDADGAIWRITQRFAPAATTGAINAEIQVSVDRDRTVEFLPLLVLFPGLGSFGNTKHQGVFAGLEYLDNEPSSSQADIVGPESHRQVPDTVKITMPLMAVQTGERYVGLIWDQQPNFSAVYDSPDRLFHSNGHVMGVIFPDSNGANRVEGSLLPYQGETLTANRPLTLRATIIGGRGQSIVPAVQSYVQLRGLPPLPDTATDFAGYARLASGGWLDSRIREGDHFRHAFWPGFAPQPAADAPMLMDWLARQSNDPHLAERLRDVAGTALRAVPPDNTLFAGVSHVRYPAPPLIYGDVAANIAHAGQAARDLLGRFEPDGTVPYKPAEGKPDYGKTHFAHHANGLTAQVVWSLLENACLSGDRDLISQAVERLRGLDQYANTVPRGAQTWEVPLHTPDILASAHLVRAYTRGYELTGDPHFLEMARYWAWTGVPFVYLINPTGQRVGPYSTIAVLGATNWQAPVWMGLPVQWCGLVYADALSRLALCDNTGPWQRLADGITATGIQMSWPVSDKDRQGLLPDSYRLREQLSDGPAINPGTVQTNAVRLFHRPALYDFHAFRTAGVLVHAPGAITNARDARRSISFTVQSWTDHPYYVLINGLRQTPRVRLNGVPTPLGAPHDYIADQGQLILQIQGMAVVQIEEPATRQ